MRVDWGMLITIFLAIVLFRIVEPIILGGRLGVSTMVTAETHSPAVPTVVYANPIDGYLAEHYPGAAR